MKAKHKKLRFKLGQTTRDKVGSKNDETVSQHTTENDKSVQEVSNILHKFMTPRDLEKELGLSITQQYKLRSARFREQNAKRGGFNLPYIKQIGVIVYDRDDVIKWLQMNKRN